MWYSSIFAYLNVMGFNSYCFILVWIILQMRTNWIQWSAPTTVSLRHRGKGEPDSLSKVHRKAIKILQYNKEKIKVATFHSILLLIKVCCYRIYWINYLNFCAFVCTPILKVYVDDLIGFNWNQQVNNVCFLLSTTFKSGRALSR